MDENVKIDYIAFESITSRQERTIKRLRSPHMIKYNLETQLKDG